MRKSPTRTPAFLEANRRNAQQSTGPYTRRGKAQSCLNRLKTGERSRVYRQLWYGLLDAPPCAVGRTAGALLTREQAAHPLFAELVDLSRWAESMTAMDERRLRELSAAKPKAWAASENQPQAPTATEEAGEKFMEEQKHLIRQPRDKGAKTQRKHSSLAWRTSAPSRLRFLESDGPIHIGSAIGLCERSFVFRTLEARSVIERGKEQNKKMLEIDVGSRNVIENTRNDDILSCHSADILGNSASILAQNARLGATKVTFSMRFNRQCTALATPRLEPLFLPDARRTNSRPLTPDVDPWTTARLRMLLDIAFARRYDARQLRSLSGTDL